MGYLNLIGGVLNQQALFSSVHCNLSDNQKKIWFFAVILGYLEGAVGFSPPPPSSNINKPTLIRVKRGGHNQHPS